MTTLPNAQFGGKASNMLSTIRIGHKGELAETRHILLEEGCHLIEKHGHFEPHERTALCNLHDKIMNKIASHVKMNANDLMILVDRHRAEGQKSGVTSQILQNPMQLTVNDFSRTQVAGSLNFLRFIKTILNNFSYPALANVVAENCANVLGLAFDDSVSWKEKDKIFDYFGIKSDIDSVKQALERPSTLRFTYPPNSIRQKTMDSVNGIEFLGPEHYTYLNSAQKAR